MPRSPSWIYLNEARKMRQMKDSQLFTRFSFILIFPAAPSRAILVYIYLFNGFFRTDLSFSRIPCFIFIHSSRFSTIKGNPFEIEIVSAWNEFFKSLLNDTFFVCTF